MKLLIGVLVAFMAQSVHAADLSQAAVETYAQNVQARYGAALDGAYKIQQAVDAFIANPSEASLENAKSIWIEARKAYSLTEVYRFYNGPIDNEENGVEGLLNAWPMDEAYIDYVIGDDAAGIIQKPDLYPTIDAKLLMSLNENGGEKNIATGYHAIEFLLWGQDLDPNGPGKRSYKDYVATENQFAERRAQYLKVVTDLLVLNLESVYLQWNPEQTGAYVRNFINPRNTKASLEKIFFGTAFMARIELARERMFVAIDTGFQEDEHSCFSDTTHNDILFNFRGVSAVIFSQEGTDLYDLVASKSPAYAAKLQAKIAEIEALFATVPPPFDIAIQEPLSTEQLLKVVTALEELGDLEVKIADELFDIQIVLE